ncbi:MAG: hypothetical protein FJW30_04440 [Acidobacteria bacterium]|nr:hypothetical protein [Acidobacteriota bacterium]
MAMESSDISNLLRKARDAAMVPKSQDPAPEAPAPQTLTPEVEGETDLLDLHAELRSDEVMLERILGLLYRAKKKNPNGGAVSILEMERQLGLEREGATFVMAYMKSTKIIEMDDKSRMSITVPGIDYLRRSLGVDTTGKLTGN